MFTVFQNVCEYLENDKKLSDKLNMLPYIIIVNS